MRVLIEFQKSVMRVIGIISEYDPFHNGHKYMIDKLRERSDADFVVCVMSGEFTQKERPEIGRAHV